SPGRSALLRGLKGPKSSEEPRYLWQRANAMVTRARAARRGWRPSDVLASYDATRRAPTHRRGRRAVGGWQGLLHERRRRAQESEPEREPELRGVGVVAWPGSRDRGHSCQGDRRGDLSAASRTLRRSRLAGD